jgi:pyruvate dehydrogenase E1 component alpha subunit/2-oxoisovalerate dehydrogenase E1 component alpha subunit
MDVHRVDGTDLEKCLYSLRAAVAAARGGSGPQMISASLLRLCGHGEHDDAHYISKELKESPLGRDCLRVAEMFLLRRGWANADGIRDYRAHAALEVDQAIAVVQRESGPDPFKENWCALASRHLSERFETPGSPLT